MDNRQRITSLMAAGAIMAEIGGGPYNSLPVHIPKARSKPGSAVRCRVCGAYGRITLYNDGDGKICANCRKERIAQRTAENAKS